MRSHHELALLADRQYGVVTSRQLQELGFSSSAIGRACGAGRLHRIHRGVYAVGRRKLSRHGHCLAALLACGSDVVLSHHSAGWLWGFLSWCPKIADVTVPARGKRREGIRVHHCPGLIEEERSMSDGIAVTSPARTLLDLAATSKPRLLSSCIDRAKRLERLNLCEIDALLERRRGAAGSPALQTALALYRTPVFDRAKSELLLLDLVKRAGLPTPVLNTWVEKFEIDAYWRTERFAVEVDGWETHGSQRAFEDDRVRIEEMALAGIFAIRISARRIEQKPREIGDRLRLLLEQRGVSSGSRCERGFRIAVNPRPRRACGGRRGPSSRRGRPR